MGYTIQYIIPRAENEHNVLEIFFDTFCEARQILSTMGKAPIPIHGGDTSRGIMNIGESCGSENLRCLSKPYSPFN